MRFGSSVALDHVNLHVSSTPGLTGIIGPNGSGKSTLLSAMMGSVEVSHGQISIDATNRDSLTRSELARRVALVAQVSEVDAPQMVTDVVMHGRLPHRGLWGRETAQDLQIVQRCLQDVGAEHLAQRSLAALSGGELQRVMIARALAQQPRYLLLDEPTNHLDVHYQHRIMGLTRNLGVRTVMVLHDLNLASHYCDEVHLLQHGRMVASGSPEEVLVPEILEPVYGIGVEVVELDGQRHLLFHRHNTPSERDT